MFPRTQQDTCRRYASLQVLRLVPEVAANFLRANNCNFVGDGLDKKRKVLLMAIILLLKRRRKRRINRKVWQMSWIGGRREKGAFHTLVQELVTEDKPTCKRYFRLDERLFKYVLERVCSVICKQDTHMRQALSADERLAVTLRYLATGDHSNYLSFVSSIFSWQIVN